MFSPPAREEDSALHSRTVEDVPTPITEQIAEDFVRYGRDSEMSAYQLYRIGEGEDERLLALDYGEVVEIFATG